MVILLICAACFLLLLDALLLAAVLGRLSELEELLLCAVGERLEEEKPRYGSDSGETESEEKALFQQRLWEEGIANLLAYMGCKKDGEKL